MLNNVRITKLKIQMKVNNELSISAAYIFLPTNISYKLSKLIRKLEIDFYSVYFTFAVYY